MSKAKHSPGPWYAVDHHEPLRRCIHSRFGTPRDKIVATLEADYTGCRGQRRDTSMFPDIDTKNANAFLITAAPDLLTALRSFVNEHDEDQRQLRQDAGITASPDDCCDCELCVSARAAIAKAEGRA